MNTIGAKKIIDKKTGAFVTGEYEYRGYRISNLDGVWTVRKQTESGDPADKVEFTAQYKALAIDGIDKILRAKTARYYIAYGSNMNVEQMRHRCPRAVVVGTSTVKDYELLFRGGKHGAVATIEPREGESVPVVIWSITPTDERSLDIYEGYPRLYEKENFVVELNGEEITAMAYIYKNEEINFKSPYLEEVVYLLSLLSPSKMNKAVNFMEKLKESENSNETALYDKERSGTASFKALMIASISC